MSEDKEQVLFMAEEERQDVITQTKEVVVSHGDTVKLDFPEEHSGEMNITMIGVDGTEKPFAGRTLRNDQLNKEHEL